MRKLFILFFLPIIGFSQNCEDSIIDEILCNNEINDYFQIALSLSLDELDYINNCDEDMSYTMFAPGNEVPTASATQLMGLDGNLIDYISYYIYPGTIEDWNNTITMIDGNSAELMSTENQIPTINNINISNSVCACNGIIYIIDNLMWSSESINLNEKNNDINLKFINSNKLLEISNIQDPSLLSIVDINGKNIFRKELKNRTSITLSNYTTGLYIISLQSHKDYFSQLIMIN